MALGLPLLASCASQGDVQRKHLGEQRFYFKCSTSLSVCLKHVTDVCRDKSFLVLRARDTRKYTGVAPVEGEFRSSEAVIECRSRGTPLFGEEPPLDAEPLPPASRPPPPPKPPKPSQPARVCLPGATQACVGVGGCAGGQACSKDASGFGPCACAPPEVESTPEAVPEEAPASGADADPAAPLPATPAAPRN